MATRPTKSNPDSHPQNEVAADEVLLTKEGEAKIQAELHTLVTKQRPEVAARVREAKISGEGDDTSEYENAKMDQAIVEGRILELKSILRRSMVLEDKDIPTDYVGIGSFVRIKDQDTGESWELRIVGPVEADPHEDRISYESPVGRALMGAKVRQTVAVDVPDGKVEYRVVKIWK